MKQLAFAVLALSLLMPAGLSFASSAPSAALPSSAPSAALPSSAPSAAHPGHDHKLMGTITSIDKNKVVVKTTEGKDMTFEVLPTTLFKRGKDRGAQAELKAGMRVVVNIGDGVEPLKAKDVQYSAITTTAKK